MSDLKLDFRRRGQISASVVFMLTSPELIYDRIAKLGAMIVDVKINWERGVVYHIVGGTLPEASSEGSKAVEVSIGPFG